MNKMKTDINMNDQAVLEKIKKFMSDNSYFCLEPVKWNEMYKMIVQWNDSNEKLSNPFILAAWYDVPGLTKLMRFNEHLDFAFRKGKIKLIDEFLNEINEDDWFSGFQNK